MKDLSDYTTPELHRELQHREQEELSSLQRTLKAARTQLFAAEKAASDARRFVQKLEDQEEFHKKQEQGLFETLKEVDDNFRLEEVEPGINVVRRDYVEPLPVGSVIAKMFRITGYARDCDGSAMAHLDNINEDGDETGWEQKNIGLYENDTIVLSSSDALFKAAKVGDDEKV